MDIKSIKRSYKAKAKDIKKRTKSEIKASKRERRKALYELHDKKLADIRAAIVERGKRAPVDPPRRHLLEEIGNSVTHGIGSLLSVVALVFMIIYSGGALELVGAIVYSFGLFAMFTMSCLYHAFPHGSRVKRLFRRFDYSGIYLLIGATFAPILLSYVGGTFGIVFFAVQWAVIITGVTFIGVFGPTRLRWLHTPLYIILGWCGIMFMPTMLKTDPWFVFYILGGGIVYSLGIIPFRMKTKVAHFIWHFFVLGGAALQWVGVFLFVYLS